MIFLRRGDPARSLDLLERTRALRRPGELNWYARRADASLGYAYALMGRASEAVSLLEMALSEVTGERVTSQAIWLTWFSEVYMALERFADARTVATRALEVAERYRHLGQLGWIQWLLAEVSLAERASSDIVEDHLARAMTLVAPRRMRPVIAHCHLTRGRLLATRGQRQAACDELRAAREAYEAMAMPYWIARADAELTRFS
jgi:tetratricopeptide (TPR) repeat protein